ncbi:MAG TPA: DUF2127 domain-containing protein [Candidatus Baltobacteraceae bacterium]|nr:DUF2127 domain-containing protein [Candidatus Baltobacteraceae bacterium]
MATEKSGHKKHRGLMAIAALKFVNGIGLLAIGLGALHYLHGDIEKDFAHWMELLRADPHNKYLIWLLEKLSNVDEHRLRQLSVGTFFYSALFLLEGTGLALAKRWAEYLTIITTASLMPVELYELYVRLTWPRGVVLVVNIVVVAYLVVELKRTRKHKEG